MGDRLLSTRFSPIYPNIIDGPSAWTSLDFSTPTEWTIALDDGDREEIFHALSTAKKRQVPPRELGRNDFPLDKLADKLKFALNEVCFGRGFAVLAGVPVELLSREEIEMAYWCLGAYLGEAVSQNGRGEVMVSVRDYRRESASGGAPMRAYQSSSALPFHTDNSDLVALLCLRSLGASSPSSFLTSSVSIHNEFVRNHKELLGVLYAGFYYHRDGAAIEGLASYFRNAIYCWFDDKLYCRYYLRKYLEHASRNSGFEISDVERLALDTFERIADSEKLKIEMTLHPGDLQLLNNNFIVHARSRYSESEEDKRELLRLWLNPRDLYTYPKDFAAFRNGMPANCF